MTTPTTTMHKQIRDALIDDPILSMLGFDHRTIDGDAAGTGPALIIRWADAWHGSPDVALGSVTIDVVGMSTQARDAVLDRIETVLHTATRRPGPITRIRRADQTSASFTVLAARPPPSSGSTGTSHVLATSSEDVSRH